MPFRLSHADSPPGRQRGSQTDQQLLPFFLHKHPPPKVISASPIIWPQRSIYALPAVMQIVEQKGER